MRDGLLGCTQACFQGKREGIVVHGCAGEVDVVNRVTQSPVTMTPTAGAPGQYHMAGGMPSFSTVEIGLDTFSRMMEEPHKFAAAANKQIKDCKEERMVAKQMYPNEVVKEYAKRKKAERKVKVSADLYRTVTPGDHLAIYQKSGYLGYRWVARLKKR